MSEERALRLAGRVVDEAGAGVGGALVRAEPGPHEVTTSADGGFCFEKLSARTYSVSARNDRFYAWPTLVDENATPITLQLQLGASFVVHVFADRAPIVGAELRLQHGFKATTDANGRAEVRGLAPIEYQAVLRADGWADEPIRLALRDDPGGLVERTFQLAPGSRIEGVVVDSNGAPLDDAGVWCHEVEHGHIYQAKCNADGTWWFGARPGTYRLAAVSETHGRSAPQTFTSDGRTTRDGIVLRIERSLRERVSTVVGRWLGARPTRIAGTVVDDQGRPGSAALVRVMCHRLVRADSNGRFEVEDLEAGEYDVEANWVGPWFERSAIRGAPQRVKTGDTNVRIVLPSGATIVGRVTLGGESVPYFGLRLLKEKESARGGMPIGVRAADGRFALRHVHPGTWRIAVIAPGTSVTISSALVITGNDTIDLGELALRRGLRIAGHVRDESGAAVAHAQVRLGRMWPFAREHSLIERMFVGVYETRTDEDGAYGFDGMDVWDEMIPTSDIILATHFNAGVSVMQEVPRTDATIDFVLLGSGRIEGVVQNLRGGHGFVLAERVGEPARARNAHCDKAGRFVFEDVPAGDYLMKLLPETGATPVSVTVVGNQTATATIVMTSVSVKLTILVPTDRGKDLVVEATSEGAAIGGNMRVISKMGTEEHCSLEFVQPGSYRVSLDGSQWHSFTITSSPAEQTIDLR